MRFFVQMKWNYQGTMDQEALWRRQLEESTFATGPDGRKFVTVVNLYKVVSQHRIIAIVDVDNVDDLDRNSMFALPMGDMLEFEHVWALRDYGEFVDDVAHRTELRPKGQA